MGRTWAGNLSGTGELEIPQIYFKSISNSSKVFLIFLDYYFYCILQEVTTVAEKRAGLPRVEVV